MNLNGVAGPAPANLKALAFGFKVIDSTQTCDWRTPRTEPCDLYRCFTRSATVRRLPDPRGRRYKSGSFSALTSSGRCEASGRRCYRSICGLGVYVECETFKGSGYTRETLEVEVAKGKNHCHVGWDYDRSKDAQGFFRPVPSYRERWDALCAWPLGYIQGGAAGDQLSGGGTQGQAVKRAQQNALTAGPLLYSG